MKTLLLKLAGPLQSWGTKSDFETRSTDLYPSKSAILGMLAACLGYRRSDDEAIKCLNGLNFAVRIDQKGNILRDFHTAKKYKANGDFERTYVTNRYYVEDAIFVVALGGEDILIEELAFAVQHPYFQPYMGRRSLPVNQDFYIKVTNEDVISAITNIESQASKWYEINSYNTEYMEIYADYSLMHGAPAHLRRDKVIAFNQKSRQFTYRHESKKTIKREKIAKNTIHDAFVAIGEDDVFIKSGN